VSKRDILLLSHFSIVFPAKCQELLVKYLYAKQLKSQCREMFENLKRGNSNNNIRGGVCWGVAATNTNKNKGKCTHIKRPSQKVSAVL